MKPALSHWWARTRAWWKAHEGWSAALTTGLGLVALGYCVAAINYQHVIAENRAQHAADVRSVADGYREALRSKDQTIATLSTQTVKAAKTADSAAKTAERAAMKAAKVVDKGHPPTGELKRWTHL